MRTRTLPTLVFVIALLNGCQAINGVLGVKPADTATDQVYKYQNTYNALVTGAIQLRINRLIPDDVYNNVFLPARRVAFQSLTDLKIEAAEDDKQGKQLDPNSVAFRALNQALNQLSLMQAQYKSTTPTGATNEPGNNTSDNSGGGGGLVDPPAVAPQRPSDANPGATPAD